MIDANKLGERIERILARENIPQSQFALAKRGEIIAAGSLGGATAESRFCIFSATKPIFASLVLTLVDDGELSLDTRVTDIWPEFVGGGKEAVTVRHLLLFTAGFAENWLLPPVVYDRARRAAAIVGWDVAWEPGSAYAYHPASAHWVLAEVVARVLGQDHREALAQRVLRPLGLDNLRLGVPTDQQQRILPSHAIGAPRLDAIEAALGRKIDAAMFDAFIAPALAHGNDAELIAAGAPGGGAISDAASVALFYQELLTNSRGIWSPAILERATTQVENILPDRERQGLSANRTIGCLTIAGDEPLGTSVAGTDFAGSHRHWGPRASSGTFGHLGAGGQIAFADPESGVSFCFLTSAFQRDLLVAAERERQITEVVFDVAAAS
jgi:CubicO group peptidase (beta-lactamase class C family)